MKHWLRLAFCSAISSDKEPRMHFSVFERVVVWKTVYNSISKMQANRTFFFARMHSGTWSDLQVLAHNIGILYTQYRLYLFGSPLFIAQQVWSLALLFTSSNGYITPGSLQFQIWCVWYLETCARWTIAWTPIPNLFTKGVCVCVCVCVCWG